MYKYTYLIVFISLPLRCFIITFGEVPKIPLYKIKYLCKIKIPSKCFDKTPYKELFLYGPKGSYIIYPF